jgi:hypothetical protein
MATTRYMNEARFTAIQQRVATSAPLKQLLQQVDSASAKGLFSLTTQQKLDENDIDCLIALGFTVDLETKATRISWLG